VVVGEKGGWGLCDAQRLSSAAARPYGARNTQKARRRAVGLERHVRLFDGVHEHYRVFVVIG
jgi:hypothetical protein